MLDLANIKNWNCFVTHISTFIGMLALSPLLLSRKKNNRNGRCCCCVPPIPPLGAFPDMNNNYLLSAFTYGKFAVGRCLPFFPLPRPPPFIYMRGISVCRFGSIREFPIFRLALYSFSRIFSRAKSWKNMLFPEKKYFNIAFVSFEVSLPQYLDLVPPLPKKRRGRRQKLPFLLPNPTEPFLALSNCAGGECPFLLNIYRPNKMRSIWPQLVKNFICAFCTYVCKAPPKKNIAFVDNFVRFPKKTPQKCCPVGFFATPPLFRVSD